MKTFVAVYIGIIIGVALVYTLEEMYRRGITDGVISMMEEDFK